MSPVVKRYPLAQHSRGQGGASVVRTVVRLSVVTICVVVASGIAVASWVVTNWADRYASNAVALEGDSAAPPDISAFDGGFTLLLAGVDECEPEYSHLFPGRCDDPDDEGTLNDVNLLVHVSDEPRRITAVSLPRDLMIPIPECSDADGNTSSAMEKQPLNSAWQYGGLSCVAKTISHFTGWDIDFAASVTFGGVIEITNAIGGVEVCLATPIKDFDTQIDWPAGNRTIEGYEALQFLRVRYGIGDGSDLGRISNQQQYMSSLARKLTATETLTNLPLMLRLADTVINNVTPSSTLADPMTLVQIGLAVKNVSTDDIVFLQYPTYDDPEHPGVKLVPNYSAAEQMWNAIEANAAVEITHETTDNDGVVNNDATDANGSDSDDPATPEEAPDTVTTPAPDDTSVAVLPSDIRGTTASTQTCTNGRG